MEIPEYTSCAVFYFLSFACYSLLTYFNRYSKQNRCHANVVSIINCFVINKYVVFQRFIWINKKIFTIMMKKRTYTGCTRKH